jgi:hypothetical protein
LARRPRFDCFAQGDPTAPAIKHVAGLMSFQVLSRQLPDVPFVETILEGQHACTRVAEA